MRKVTLLLNSLLLMLATVGSTEAVAQKGVNRLPAPLTKVAAPGAQKKAPARVIDVNAEKALGVKMYASTQTDYQNDPGLIRFYSGNTYETEKVAIMADRDFDPTRRVTMFGGTLYTDPETNETAYVGFQGVTYDLGVGSWPHNFMKFNPETGERTIISEEIKELKGDWLLVEGMCQNPVDKQLWAICQDSVNLVSRIGTIDPESGELLDNTKLNYYYPAFAIDAKGQFWAIRCDLQPSTEEEGKFSIEGSYLTRLDPEHGFAEIDPKEITLGSWDGSANPFKIWYNNTIAFDYSTGELYGLLCQFNEWGYPSQHLYYIDTATGNLSHPMNKEDRTSGSYCYDMSWGLAIPSYFAEAPEAPARVENLSNSFSEDGKQVILTWTNPTLSWGGDTLTKIDAINIYRNDLDSEPIAVLTDGLTPGAEASWTDEAPVDGISTYYVLACVDEQKGIPNSWNVYAGEDTPAEVQNIQISRDGTKINLSWEAPTQGQHMGAYDAATLTYSVQRLPDSVMVAENIVETALVDKNLPALMNYSYIITPATKKGAGEPAESYSVMAGPAYEVPYTTEFADYAEADAWTIVDNNADGTMFYYSNWDPSCTGLAFNTNSYGNSDDYAISPSVKLQEGHTYKVEYDIYFAYVDSEDQPTKHDFDITVGEGTTAEAQATVLKEVRQFGNDQMYSRHKFDAQFTPEADGEYNFGLHWLTANIYDNLTLCGASIKEVVDKDMAVKSVKGATNPSNNIPADYKVTVANEGRLEASNYVVKMVRIDGENQEVLGQTEVADVLAAGADTVIVVTALPDMEGETQYAAVVELEGDELASNNMSAPFDVTVSPEGTVPFNAEANTNENMSDVTEMPFYFWKDYSTVQSIYYPSDFQEPLSGTATISRLAFEYRDNDGGVVTDVPVKIYLGTTDIEAYEAEANSWGSKVPLDQWIPLTDQVLVYEGTFSTKLGSNLLIFDFTKPFEYDVTKNLVVTVQEESIQENKWPVIFKTYAFDSYSEIYRSLRYGSNSQQFDFESADMLVGACNARQGLPVLHLALTVDTGIKNVTAGENAAAYDATTGSINFNGFKAAKVTVYNVAGQTVAQGNNSKLNLNSGAYVVKAVANDGKVYTSKLQVK